jgi:hypothetical protein
MAYSDVVLSDNPMAYFRLNETSGTAAVDSTGLNANGTYGGTAPPTLDQLALLSGDPAKAPLFSGNSLMTVPHHVRLNGSSGFSIEFWARYTALPALSTTWTPVTKFSTAYELSVFNSAGNVRHYLNTSGVGASVTGGAVLAADTTYHVVGVWDEDRKYIWVNGVLQASAVATGTLGVNTGNVRLGLALEGYIGEFAFYNVPLSPERVWTHWSVGKELLGGANIKAPMRKVA